MIRAFRLLIFGCLCGLPWAGTAFAQPASLVLQGTVIGWDSAPIPGAKLTLDMEGQETRVLVTDESGAFRFEGLPEGPYRLNIEVPGIATFQHSATLDPGTSRETLEIQCSPDEGGKVRSLPELPTVFPMPPPVPPPPMPPPPASLKGFAEVEVFYGTDRVLRRGAPVEERFGPTRMSFPGLHLGVCRVSIPRDHRMGEIERPSIWKLEMTADPDRHMVLLGIEELGGQSFYQRLQGKLARSGEGQLLVFVHGYNVSFHDAALRTAQLAYDLGLDGAPVLYSWPSKASLAGYTVDESSVEATIPRLEAFLRELSERSGARSIYLIAHSMGNRALTRALERISLKQRDGAKPPFSQIVLTAPDIDAAVFADLAGTFRHVGERVTLYASSNDEALKASKKVHGYPRAGESTPEVLVLPGIDTVDVSGVDTSLLGHSYFGDNCSVISDLAALLRRREPPDRRTGLEKRQRSAGLAYWVFSAASASCSPPG
ncbi:MAG: alpha/beta hydrolase [Acidobacteriota bacterium]